MYGWLKISPTRTVFLAINSKHSEEVVNLANATIVVKNKNTFFHFLFSLFAALSFFFNHHLNQNYWPKAIKKGLTAKKMPKISLSFSALYPIENGSASYYVSFFTWLCYFGIICVFFIHFPHIFISHKSDALNMLIKCDHLRRNCWLRNWKVTATVVVIDRMGKNGRKKRANTKGNMEKITLLYLFFPEWILCYFLCCRFFFLHFFFTVLKLFSAFLR